MDKISKAVIDKLEQYNQLHLIHYFHELSQNQKEFLLSQINEIDFNLLSLLEKEHIPRKGRIEPIEALKITEIEKQKDDFYRIGIEAIREGKVGAVLLAGGQGTRLGFDRPKGTLDVGINKELYLFEILINNIKDVADKAGAWIPLFVMTSEINNADTIEFFTRHKFFGYNKDYITFFVQEMTPAVDYNGRIYMEEKWKISMSPNGNGGWFSSLAKHKILDKIKHDGIQWLNVFSVDNVLQKIADPYFTGAVIKAGYPVGSKVIKKTHPDEKVGVICREDGRPSIVEYYELTDELKNAKDETGDPAYNYGVTLNYLFRVRDLEMIMENTLPSHIVEKKIPYIDSEGNYVNPEKPNGYKFETLVLDMIHMLDNCLVYEVEREKEFAPVKNKDGMDSLETARELLIKNGITI